MIWGMLVAAGVLAPLALWLSWRLMLARAACEEALHVLNNWHSVPALHPDKEPRIAREARECRALLARVLSW